MNLLIYFALYSINWIMCKLRSNWWSLGSYGEW